MIHNHRTTRTTGTTPTRRLVVLLATLLTAAALSPLHRAVAAPPPPEVHYVTVSDGIEIAVRVDYPEDYTAGQTYPALFEMNGYGGAGDEAVGFRYPGYVRVTASVRGTGCSGGYLDLFSWRSAVDGREIIDHWLPTQPWFNGDAGIVGHSYSGITGFLVATTQPALLRAVRVGGLIDDFYRGILYPGGVPNPGFPLLWGAGLRPISEHTANLDELLSDGHCLQNFLQHGPLVTESIRTAIGIYGAMHANPDSWAIQRSLFNKAHLINVPIQMLQQYQDEQTGPRGANTLWQMIDSRVPKRLTLSTGQHNPSDPTGTGQDWLDCWILHQGDTTPTTLTTRGRSCADVLDPGQRVLAFFESTGNTRNPPYVSSDWPLPETDWTRYYLKADGTLDPTPTGGDGPRQYLSTSAGRQLTLDGGFGVNLLGKLLYPLTLPDTLTYSVPFIEDTAIAGPVNLSLWATVLLPDVDFFVEVLDRNLATGETTFVQRGLLRASFQETVASEAGTVPSGPHAGEVYRPHRTYLQNQPLAPGQPYQFDIEVFPFGHVFHEGHAMVLQIHAPATNDPISTFLTLPNLPNIVTILQGPAHRSSVLVPTMPVLPPIQGPAPACGAVTGELCLGVHP